MHLFQYFINIDIVCVTLSTPSVFSTTWISTTTSYSCRFWSSARHDSLSFFLLFRFLFSFFTLISTYTLIVSQFSQQQNYQYLWFSNEWTPHFIGSFCEPKLFCFFCFLKFTLFLLFANQNVFECKIKWEKKKKKSIEWWCWKTPGVSEKWSVERETQTHSHWSDELKKKLYYFKHQIHRVFCPVVSAHIRHRVQWLFFFDCNRSMRQNHELHLLKTF